MAKTLAAVDLSFSTRLVPYDDRDDVLWEHHQRRRATERAPRSAPRRHDSSRISPSPRPTELATAGAWARTAELRD